MRELDENEQRRKAACIAAGVRYDVYHGVVFTAEDLKTVKTFNTWTKVGVCLRAFIEPFAVMLLIWIPLAWAFGFSYRIAFGLAWLAGLCAAGMALHVLRELKSSST